MTPMRIGSREINPEFPPYVIAEIGVNHDGSADRAVSLTHAAADAGADAVKLQLFTADALMSKAAKLAAYQRTAGETDPLAMLRRLELSIDDMAPVVRAAHARGIHAIVSVFSVEHVAIAERLPWDAYKTASPDVTNRPLLDALAATGKPLIVSTGASTMDEVRRAIAWLAPIHDRLAVLHCVSSYPAAPDDANVDAMRAVMAEFRGPVGYSDHTPDLDTGALAVGPSRSGAATILEKHLTFSRRAAGPDHAASLEPSELAEYIRLARDSRVFDRAKPDDPSTPCDVRLGDGRKRVLPCERDVRRVSRQSLAATRDLPAGHVLTRADLTIKRPGTGLEPFRLHEVLGRATTRTVEADMPLTHADILGLPAVAPDVVADAPA